MADINFDKIPLEQIGPFAKLGIGLLKKILTSAWKGYGKRKSEKLLSTVIMELLKVHPDIDAAKAKLIAIKATNSKPNLHLLRAESLLKKVEYYSLPTRIFGVRRGEAGIARMVRRSTGGVRRYQGKSIKITLPSIYKKPKKKKRKDKGKRN